MAKPLKLFFTFFLCFLFMHPVFAKETKKTYYRSADGNYIICKNDNCKAYEPDDSKVKTTNSSNKIKFKGETYEFQAPETNWGSINDTNLKDVCSDPNFRKPMKVIGMVVNLVKIIIPMLIIVLGIFDLFKAVTNSKDDRIATAVKSIAIRLIAGVVIFFLPGIVQMILDWVNEWSAYKNTWCCCTQCILDYDNCDVNACSSESCKIGGMN